MRKSQLVIHHSATEDGDTFLWSAIRNFHVIQRGWRDIGYHLGFENIGGGIECLVGRPLLARAAAVRENNLNAIGVHACFVGNYDKVVPNDAMLKFAAPILADIMRVLGIHIEDVRPHTFFASYKTCPGKLFPMDRLKTLIRGAM